MKNQAKTKNDFDQYMDKLFKGYPAEARERVEADCFYQEAASKQNATKAAEVAQVILEGSEPNRVERRLMRLLK